MSIKLILSNVATISLLIFCVNDLSIDVNEVLKSPTVTLSLYIH